MGESLKEEELVEEEWIMRHRLEERFHPVLRSDNACADWR